MAKPELAERLLDALPDEYKLTEGDTEMVGALVTDRGPSGLSWSTRNGKLVNMTIAGETVETAADLRRALSTLPPRSERKGSIFAEAIADAILRAVIPMRRELVITRVKLSTLIEVLEERGVELGADYTRRWYSNYERDARAIWDLVSDESEEADARFGEHHADWLALQDDIRRRRFGREADEALRVEWNAIAERLRTADEKRRAECEAAEEDATGNASG